jgi:hypothetical protein
MLRNDFNWRAGANDEASQSQIGDEFRQAPRAGGEGNAPPQMHGPSQLMYLLAALAQGLDPKGNIGANFLGGFNQAAGLRFQNDQARYQAGQQQKLNLEQEAEKKAALQREEERYQAEWAYKRLGDQREDQTRRYLGQLAYDRTLDKSKADNEAKLQIAGMRAQEAAERIRASLSNGNRTREASWIAVLNNPQATPEMRQAAFASLQSLNPAVYEGLNPEDVQRAVNSSPAIQRLTVMRIETEKTKKRKELALAEKYATDKGLNEARKALLGKDLQHYDEKVLNQAADLHSRIHAREQAAEQRDRALEIQEENGWSLRDSRNRAAAKEGRGSILGRNRALGSLELQNIKIILARHGGQPPEPDDDDYESYATSVANLQKAKANIDALGEDPAAKAAKAVGAKAGQTAGTGVAPTPAAKPRGRVSNDYREMEAFAGQQGFRVTSGLATSGHNVGSPHYTGNAVDVSVRGKSDKEVKRYIKAALASGFKIRDERTRPEGQAVWSGPHLHMERAPEASRPQPKPKAKWNRTSSGNSYKVAG